jgi:hypothetical protein
MVERRKQGLCYYCDENYSSGHKFHEKKFFYTHASTSISHEDITSNQAPDQEDTQPSFDLDDLVSTLVEPTKLVISLHALLGISVPQTLNIKGYVKHRSVVVLIDCVSTHNFIHHRLAEDLHCFVHTVSNFQILIANGGMMKCGGRCENFKLQMGDYHFKTHMLSISMGGCEIVLGVEWLRTMGPITMDYQDLYMIFTQEAHPYTLQSLQVGSHEIINSHRMENLLNKGHHGVIAQFNVIQVTDQASPEAPPSLQIILDKYPGSLRFQQTYLPRWVSTIITSLSFWAIKPPMYAPTSIHLLKK